MRLFLLVHQFSVHPHSLLDIQLWTLPQFDPKTYSFLFLACSFATIGFFLILILYTERILVSEREKKINALKFKYQYLIYEALVESQTENKTTAQQLIVEKLKKDALKTNLHKQVLADLIIDLKKNFSGDSEKQFIQLYEELNLSQYSLKKLGALQWDVQAKGIRELTEMNHGHFATQLAITGLRHAKNHTVAEEAHLASVRLDKTPLSFLHDLQSPLTAWQQINLHHFLLKTDRKSLPDFAQWLSSANESVVLFALRMIVDFEQKHAVPQVLPCVGHLSVLVKEEAIRTLIKLEAKNTLPQLLEACQSCPENSCLLVIKAIPQWGDRSHIALLEPLLQHPSSKVHQAAKTAMAKLSQHVQKKMDTKAIKGNM